MHFVFQMKSGSNLKIYGHPKILNKGLNLANDLQVSFDPTMMHTHPQIDPALMHSHPQIDMALMHSHRRADVYCD